MSPRSFAACWTIILLTICSLAFGKDAKPDPQEKLETAIPEAIRILEGKEYKKFIELYAIPEELQKIKAEKPLDEPVESFAESNAASLLKTLKSIKDLKPKFEDEGNTATYEFKERIDGMKSITFKKIEKRWRVQN